MIHTVENSTRVITLLQLTRADKVWVGNRSESLCRRVGGTGATQRGPRIEIFQWRKPPTLKAAGPKAPAHCFSVEDGATLMHSKGVGVCVYIHMCVCVCVCLSAGRGRGVI